MELGKMDVHAHLPVGLIERVDRFVLRGLYSTRTEFISEALRKRIEELEEKEKDTEPNMLLPVAPLARTSNHKVIANER